MAAPGAGMHRAPARPGQLPRLPAAETPSAPSFCYGSVPPRLCSSPGAFSFAPLPRLAVRAKSHRSDTEAGLEDTDRQTDNPLPKPQLSSKQAPASSLAVRLVRWTCFPDSPRTPGSRWTPLGAVRAPRWAGSLGSARAQEPGEVTHTEVALDRW